MIADGKYEATLFDADKVWTLLAKKVGPLQIDFGEAEWQQMIDRIRQLKSWEGVVGC